MSDHRSDDGFEPPNKRQRESDIKRPSPELCKDTILEILHRLPAKSLARFKCVSKTWRRFIAGSSFESCRSQRRKPSPRMIGFFSQYTELLKGQDITFCFAASGDRREKLCGQFDESLEFLRFSDRPPVIIMASSNGFLLCCDSRHHCMNYYVCNPATKQFVVLPHPYRRHQHVAHGFVCDAKDLIDYRVIRLLMPKPYRLGDPETNRVRIESFSSVTGTWDKINLQVTTSPFRLYGALRPAVVMDGVFLWLDWGEIVACDVKEKNCWLLRFPDCGLFTSTYSCLSVHHGVLYFGLEEEEVVKIWTLAGCFRSRSDCFWNTKYRVRLVSFAWQFLDDSYAMLGATFIDFHPADPDIIYIKVRGYIISYDFSSGIGELLLGRPENLLKFFFPYEWHEWPRLLY